MPKFCFVGNFNAGVTNTSGAFLEDFCVENDFIICDYAYVLGSLLGWSKLKLLLLLLHAILPRTHLRKLVMNVP